MEDPMPGILPAPYNYVIISIYFNDFAYSFLIKESPLLNFISNSLYSNNTW
jgi:hypothetical protein